MSEYMPSLHFPSGFWTLAIWKVNLYRKAERRWFICFLVITHYFKVSPIPKMFFKRTLLNTFIDCIGAEKLSNEFLLISLRKQPQKFKKLGQVHGTNVK